MFAIRGAVAPRGAFPPIRAVMLVDDVFRTAAFYRDVLGFEVVLLGPSGGGGAAWALFRRGTVEVFVQSRAALAGTLPMPALPRPGALTLYLDVQDAATLYERVRAHACLVRPLHAPAPGRRAFAVLDPDGVLLVFTETVEEAVRAA